MHEVQLLDSLAASDHCMITWKVDINRPIVRRKKVFDYNMELTGTSMSVSRVKPTCLQQQDGTNTSTPEQTCDSFNDYFSSVFTSESMDSIGVPRVRKG